jgi:diguanylate cyclase (GGDEF)-like protein
LIVTKGSSGPRRAERSPLPAEGRGAGRRSVLRAAALWRAPPWPIRARVSAGPSAAGEVPPGAWPARSRPTAKPAGRSAAEGGWLFGSVDRGRLLDMDRRIGRVRNQAMGVLLASLLIAAPWVGFWTLAPAVAAGALFALATWRSRGSVHPERMIFAAWVGSEVIIAASIALSGTSRVATFTWLAIPVVTLAARFPGRPLKVGVAIALGLLAAVALGSDGRAVLDDPVLVTGPATVILAVALLSTALTRSEMEHRDRSLIDGLTGMLNRSALESRAVELAQQSALSGEPVGLIIADVDHFKRINDSDGHKQGDAVLAEVAHRVRRQLRAFDLVYRFGGEEFVVLLPGADLREAERLAGELRRAVSMTPVEGGRRVTLSCGASASARGTTFSYEDVFAAADRALYEAKRGGRDRVCVG